MGNTENMSPESIISQIEKQNLRVSPIIELMAQIGDGKTFMVACDCSGCNNSSIFIPNQPGSRENMWG